MDEIPPLIIPVIPSAPIPPPTRGMGPPVTRGMEPPTALIPGYDAPTLNLPPTTFTNPDPGTPRGGPTQPQQQEESTEEEDTREMPEEIQMAPFDASTQIDFTVPIIEIPVSIPVPKPEVVITAGTTAMTAAVTATGAAIMSKPLFDWLMKKLKPLAKKIAKKLLQKKVVVYPDSTPLQLPDQLRFSGDRLTPPLSRQHRDRRKEKKGAKKPPAESTQNTSEP